MNIRSAPDMRNYISGLLAQRRDYRQEVRDLTAKYQYVVFYGCGAIFHGIVDSWRNHLDRHIDYCCDSDNAKWGKIFCGIPCISPKDLATIKDECIVYVTIGDFQPIFHALVTSGFPSVRLISKNALDIAGFLSTNPHEGTINKLYEVYNILADTKSKDVFCAVIDHVLDAKSDPETMLNVCEKNQYFPPDVIKLSEQERLVDVGAFNGDTILDFIGQTKGKFDRIFAFELDVFNFHSLHENVQCLPERNRISIFNLGIWDRECDMAYSISESQSTVRAGGEGKGHVVSLDDVLGNEKVTFIKMDIEGTEPQALRGARRILQAQKPKLAICVYHDFRHLWEIPLYLKSLVPEYKIYLRHHTNLEYETVAYAVL